MADPIVQVELATSLDDLLAECEPARQSLDAVVTSLMAQMGVPGRAESRFTRLDEAQTDRLVRLTVNGSVCRFPDQLVRRVLSSVLGTQISAEEEPRSLLRAPDHGAASPANSQTLRDFLNSTCVEIIGLDPSVLLGPEQATRYAESLSVPPPSQLKDCADPQWRCSVLGPVLRLGVSIADRQVVERVLAQARVHTTADIAELLIDALSPPAVEIDAPMAYLRAMTQAEPTNARGLFQAVRTILFAESGVLYPPFRFVQDDSLRENTFRFRIAHVTWTPMLDSDPDRFACLARSLMEALRMRGASLLTRSVVQRQVSALQAHLPALIRAASSRFTMEMLTGILRSLAAERVTIRNLRLILEALLDWHETVPPGSRDNVDQAVAWVRTSLSRQLAHQYARFETRPHMRIVAWELAPDLDDQLVARASAPEWAGRLALLSDEELDRLASIIRSRLRHNGAGSAGQAPVLLTSPAARPLVRACIALEFPELAVLSRAELPPETEFAVEGSISLAETVVAA